MNDDLKIETILGYVAKHNHLRACRDGKTFEEMIPAPAWSEETVIRNGSVCDTVDEMKKIIKHYAYQAQKVSRVLKGRDVYDTCHNIWDFLYTHIKYKEDEEGKEQLRTFARSWAQRRSRGIDCDDFSIAAGSLLYNLNIPFYIRIARYAGKDYFQHVYPVVPLKDKRYITIDAVLDEYDAEKEPVETKDFLVMNTSGLNGVDISVLGGIEDDTLNEISGILTGADFEETNQLEGLGQIPSRDMELRAIRKHLMRTRQLVHRSPNLIKGVEHPDTFLGMVDYALKYWDTDKREEALGVLEGEEDRLNVLEGLSGTREDHEDVNLFYGLNSLGGYDVLGKAKRQRKFFAKIKQAVKKAGQGIKKIAKALVRFNPLTVTIRAAVLLALKVNLFKVGSKLKWGYLTEAEAQQHGFDMTEWRKTKSQLTKAESLFVKTLQGKAENFKRAILSGRAGGLSGTGMGLGVVVAAATAASTTAAVPFITKIMGLLKNINFKKLVENVNLPSLRKGRKEAEEETPTEDGGSSIPENSGESTPTDSGDATPPATDIPDTSDASVNMEAGTDAETDTQQETPGETEGQDNPSDEGGEGEAGTDQVAGTDVDTVEKVKNGFVIFKNIKEKFKNRKKRKGQASPPVQKTSAPTNNPNNLPILRKQELPVKVSEKKPSTYVTKAMLDLVKQANQSPIDKLTAWVKANPGKSLLIGTGTALLVAGAVALLKNRAKSKALSGTRGKGKKKKGKAKKTPPKTINGTGRRKKSRGRGKGGSAKRVKL